MNNFGLGNLWRAGPQGDWRGSGFNMPGRRNARGFQTNIFGQPYGQSNLGTMNQATPLPMPSMDQPLDRGVNGFWSNPNAPEAPFDTQATADTLLGGGAVNTTHQGPNTTNTTTRRPLDPMYGYGTDGVRMNAAGRVLGGMRPYSPNSLGRGFGKQQGNRNVR